MRDDNEIEGLSLTDLTQFLETCQIAGVIIKILGKLIPDKNNSFQFIRTYNLSNPIAQCCCAQRESFNLTFICYFEDIIHDFGKSVSGKRGEFFENGIHIVASE
ncbi:hypothetical protein SDC9_168165 [bioreactor metagenome]|uniref:Uncharacterized protein n=1 Tax=bioreactor metagenome TaxID=1076179 RepID=A0A645G3S5_9ZZZZ